MYFTDTYQLRFADEEPWDESKVKRDEKGRFSFTNATKAVAEKIRNALVRVVGERTIGQWVSEIDQNRGKSYDELKAKYGTESVPIAVMPKEHVGKFEGEPKNNLVYCSKAYFINHAVNNHDKDVSPEWYKSIQSILDTGKTKISRVSNGRHVDGLVFYKKFSKNRRVVVALEPNSKGMNVIFYKTFFVSGSEPKDRPWPPVFKGKK